MDSGKYSKDARLDFIGSSGGIDEFKLTSNGMRVLLAEENSAPVVVTMVTYHVGSRNEAIGYTGSTHLLEHLMFKGSKNYNKDKGTSIWTVLQAVGANINATTWNDRTNYFELLPKEHLEMALSIESDRMRSAFINESDRQTEMTVVRNEFERGENDPHEALDKAIWATAYQAHPYHHSTIGWKADIENVPIERLREFYDTFYHPNNATLTIVGDFEREAVKELVLKYFGVIAPSSHKIPDMYTEEPEQEGQRRITVKRAGKTGYIGVGFKTPPALHADQYSLRVLSNILTSGKASRLYKVIVDKALSTWISADNSSFKDNGLFIVYTQLTPSVKHEEIEKIILEEIEKIKNEGVTEDEVKRAQAQIETALALSRDGPLSIARSLNEAIAIGDWKWYTTLIDRIREVTPESVKKVTQKYFLEDQSTIGYFIPKSDAEAKAKTEEKGEEKVTKEIKALAEAQTEQVVKREVVKSNSYAERISVSAPVPGIKLLAMKTAIKDVITLYGSLLAGENYSPKENPTIAAFTAKMLDQGTQKRTKFQISELLGSVGATISFSCGKFHVRFSSKFLKKDIPLVIELLAEQMREPSFNAADLETVKKRDIGRLEQAKQNTDTRAEIAFLQSLYPRDHPNYAYDIDEAIGFIKALTIDDIKNYHREKFGKGTFKIAAVGDLDEEVISASLKKHFGDWRTSPIDSIPAIKLKAHDPQSSQKMINILDKTSCDVYVGTPIGINRDHPDFLPVVVANFALGGDFSARLMDNVRDKEGLTYGIYSLISGCDFGCDGYFAVWGTFSPALLEKGGESTMKQLEKWVKDGVAAEELDTKKKSITGSYKVRLATTGGLADNILTNEERGRPTSYLDDYPNLINKITLEEINTVIRKYVNLTALTKVAAGTFESDPQSKL